MDQIHIVNYLLTRRCNLNCSYCALVKDYNSKPSSYPNKSHYIQNEIDTNFVNESLRRLKLHNPNIFIILYGGEPLLRKDLPDIVNFCNDNDINYTIITNNTHAVQPMLNRLIEKTDYIQGLTSSVDPMGLDDDISKKSQWGMNQLIKLKEQINDVVAEITVSNDNVKHLYDTVKVLSDNGISSSITFIDIAKSPFYDFSNIKDYDILVNKNKQTLDVLNQIIDDDLDVHMKDELLHETYMSLPSEHDCEFEKGIHNISIDADGSVRLCLRIRGVLTPTMNLLQYLDTAGNFNSDFRKHIINDKSKYCQKCNWTCTMMSKIISYKENQLSKLLHSDRRK